MAIQSRDSILRKIREALSQTTPIPFPKSEGQSSVFEPLSQEIAVEFAERFTAIQGKFAFCLNNKELKAQLQELVAVYSWEKVFCVEPEIITMLGENIVTTSNPDELASCNVAITDCEYLVARTGSILMSTAQKSGRSTSVYAPVHICIAYSSQLVYDIKDALDGMKEKYGSQIPSMITLATGPSRTADIEKTLVVGIHGPKEVFVFLVEDEN